ncbi:hypothetical protein ACHAXR_009629 [Thalassiosira sp. AJA248-18]
MIDVTGWFDFDDSDESFGPQNGNNAAREFFVQRSPKLKEAIIVEGGRGTAWWNDFPTLMPCEGSNEQTPVVVDLRTNVVSPTHYSLRWGECYGLQGNWNFEASPDGENWILLHAGRDDDGHKVSYKRACERRRCGETEKLRGLLSRGDEVERQETFCDYMERNYRHIWELDNSSGHFFRYFRMIGADTADEIGRCLHAIGLEIYGDVQEE